MSFPTQAMLYKHLTSGRSLSTILIIHHTSESSTFILLPKRSLLTILTSSCNFYFILLPKEVYSSYFRKKSFNNSYHSSYFRKQYIHLTSKRSLSTILTSYYNFYFILLPKEVYSSYFRRKSFNNSYHSSYFRKKSIHLTSERSLSMILILHQTSQRGKFILPPKQVFQQFLLPKEVLQHSLQFISLSKEVRSSYFRKQSFNNSYCSYQYYRLILQYSQSKISAPNSE